MKFTGHGRLLCAVACVVLWSYAPLTAAQVNNTAGPVLWPDYFYTSETTANTYGYFTEIPFNYFNYKTIAIKIYGNGYLSFGYSYYEKEPPQPAEWPYTPKLLGIYWSKLIPYTFKANSTMYISYESHRLQNVSYENSLIRYVKDAIGEPDFEPLLIIAATWENIRPQTNDNDTATFQVLVATDSQVTYAIRGYQSVWKSPELANVTCYAATYSQGYGQRPKIVIPGSLSTPEVILLGTKQPTKDPYTCVANTQAIIARLNTSLNVLPPCPCYEVQATEDKEFMQANGSARCYQSRTLPQEGSLYQQCCYNLYGHLVNYTKKAGIPVPADLNDRSLQEANEKCCADGSGLCEWFQGLIYLTKCTDYRPVFNDSLLPIFYNSQDDIVWNRNSIGSVALSVTNSTGVKYSILTTFNSSYGISLYGNTLTWNIFWDVNKLRKVSFPQRLVVYATNANNMSASFAPRYTLCLCQDSKQCNNISFSYGRDTFIGPDSYTGGNVNVMGCDCKGNATGRFCEKLIHARDYCPVENTTGCSSPTDFCPVCPVGYQTNGTQCIGPVLWADYVYTSETTVNSQGHFANIPFNYFNYKTSAIYIYSNGYLSFGSSYDRTEPPPPAEWPYTPKLLGMYWSKLTPYLFKDYSSIYTSYESQRLQNVSYENSLIRYVKNAIGEPDFEPLLIIAATWENIRPQTNDNDTATFQVLVATDSQVTYAIRGYQSVWKSPELANVTYYAAAYSQGYGQRPKIVIPGSLSAPEVILLGTKQPTKDPYTCVANTQAIVARLGTSLNVLPPCPCYEVQATEDQEFKKADGSVSCYQSRTLPKGGSLYQQCCYNMYGHLVNYTKEAGIPVPSDPNDRSLQEANEKCCADGSGLCEWFQYIIFRTKCADYRPAFNDSTLPRFYSQDDVVWNGNSISMLGLPITSSTGVKYSILTTFNSSYSIFMNGNTLTWNIFSDVDKLRNVSFPQRLVVYATNANNMSASFDPRFLLCLCQNSKQCNKYSFSYSRDTFIGPDSYTGGNVNVMGCDCKGNMTGRFCEKPISACDNCLVENTTGCSSNPPDYCPPCPFGYQRNGTQCIVIIKPSPTSAPDSGHSTESVYFLVVLCVITSYTLGVQNLLTTRM